MSLEQNKLKRYNTDRIEFHKELKKTSMEVNLQENQSKTYIENTHKTIY